METEMVVTPGGVDTIHCSFYCSWTPKVFENIRKIATAKMIAEHPSDDEDAPDPVFLCEDREYVVMPYGFNPGDSKYCYFQYVLKAGGITIGIQPREYKESLTKEPDKNKSPNVRVEVGALPLILAGSMQTIMDEVEERLSEMGFIIRKNRLGRVDCCVDLPFAVSGLQMAILERRFITRARSWSMYVETDDTGWDEAQILGAEYPEDGGLIALHGKGYACTGFSIGKDKIMCRGYDKLEKEKYNEEMQLALAQRRFGGELPENVTRIEFQLRRDALRGITVCGCKDGIETWQDFVKYQGAIVKYLCTEWLIFTEKKFDRTHTHRIKTCPDAWHSDWLKVVSAFKRAYGDSDQKIVRLNGSIKREANDHIAQALGCGQSAILKTNMILSPWDPRWKEKVAAFQYKSTMRYLSDPDKQKAFWRNWNDKELRQEASLPEECLSDIVGEAFRGAGVTHHSPKPGDDGIQLTPAGASGPAPDVIS